MPYTWARLLEDGWSFAGQTKNCRGCGMLLYCFAKGDKKRWLNMIERNGEKLYQEHDTWICSGRRGRRDLPKPA